MTSASRNLDPADIAAYKGIRFVGAVVLVLSALYLFCGGVLHLAKAPIYQWAYASALEHNREQPENPITGDMIFDVVWWDSRFPSTIWVAVLVGAAAFWGWIVAYRHLIRSRGFCSSCNHDLREIHCPECGSSPAEFDA